MHLCSSLITGECVTCTSYGFRLRQLGEVKKGVYLVLNMGIFLTKTHRFGTGGLYSPPRSRVKQILTWIDAVYLTAFGLLKNTHPLPL